MRMTEFLRLTTKIDHNMRQFAARGVGERMRAWA